MYNITVLLETAQKLGSKPTNQKITLLPQEVHISCNLDGFSKILFSVDLLFIFYLFFIAVGAFTKKVLILCSQLILFNWLILFQLRPGLSNNAVIKSCICIICFREELLVMEGTQKQARATFIRKSTRNGKRLCFHYLK